MKLGKYTKTEHKWRSREVDDSVHVKLRHVCMHALMDVPVYVWYVSTHMCVHKCMPYVFTRIGSMWQLLFFPGFWVTEYFLK